MAGGHLPTPQAPGLGSTSADGNMISTECLSSQWGLFITSDTEGFKDRANITINTNSTKHHRKEDYKSLVVFSRSSVVLFTNCRVFSVNFFFFFAKGMMIQRFWSNTDPSAQSLMGYPDSCFNGHKLILFHTVKSLPLQTSPAPSSCISRRAHKKTLY